MLNVKTKVAVYGSLREGFHNHRLLNSSHKLGMTQSNPEWTMISLGSFPAIVPGGETPIVLEVYEVDNEVFSNLDMLEGYPHFYDRKEIETEFGTAWVYFLTSPEGYSMWDVPSGDWADVKERCA